MTWGVVVRLQTVFKNPLSLSPSVLVPHVGRLPFDAQEKALRHGPSRLSDRRVYQEQPLPGSFSSVAKETVWAA